MSPTCFLTWGTLISLSWVSLVVSFRFHRWIETWLKTDVSRTQFETCQACTVKVKNLFSHPCSHPWSFQCHLLGLCSPSFSHRGLINKSNFFPFEGLCTNGDKVRSACPRSQKPGSFPLQISAQALSKASPKGALHPFIVLMAITTT